MPYPGGFAKRLTHEQIRLNAVWFSKRYQDATYERGESQSFYNDLFAVYGIDRKGVARFEKKCEKLNQKNNLRMDLFYPNVLLAEHKSANITSLEHAKAQANQYLELLPANEIPAHILLCNFQQFELYNIENHTIKKFTLDQLPDNIRYLMFIRGESDATLSPSHQLTIEATMIMSRIYKALQKNEYVDGLDILMTRLTFCMFADYTGIFESNIFRNYIYNSNADEVGNRLQLLFETLNMPVNSRQRNLKPELSEFTYVNGDLFKEVIQTPYFTESEFKLLKDACDFDWKDVSPIIFGSLFQGVMDNEDRETSGSHYTEYDNIMKIIKPLFLDDLYEEFERIKQDRTSYKKSKLEKFQNKLSGLRILDPACGSGNFLIIAYAELRKLELRVIAEIQRHAKNRMVIVAESKIKVEQMYGMDLNRFACKITETGLWMMDHLMNRELSNILGFPYLRIPLPKSPNIYQVDALDTDWNDILPAQKCSCILGNPPFKGSKRAGTTQKQKREIKKQRDQIFKITGSGQLDYVTGWFVKAARYVEDAAADCRVGFVGTNSITQGQQAGVLWPLIFQRGLEILFAYRPIKWNSGALEMAQVTVTLIGFGRRLNGHTQIRLFDENNNEVNPPCISPYLFGCDSDISQVTVTSSTVPLNNLPEIRGGSQLLDFGHYTFDQIQRREFLSKEPKAKSYLKPYVGSREMLHGIKRWVLDLNDAPLKIRNLSEVKKRIQSVKQSRLDGGLSARQQADFPTRFNTVMIPKKPFLVMPETSSENYEYMPILYFKPPTIPSHGLRVCLNATPALFGLLTSKMHMLWLDVIGGKLETRNRYSVEIVYNTFPAPENYDVLEKYGQDILDIRERYNTTPIAELYKTLMMPDDLRKAHKSLDSAVDRLYDKRGFESSYERILHLVDRYSMKI